jgi:hypothetical protein
MDFEIIDENRDKEIIAVGRNIRNLKRLQKQYGRGRWRKIKGITTVRLKDDTICTAEVHWYEASGIGRKEFKLKFLLHDD